MIEKTHPGSVESSYSLTVRRTRQKLSRQRAARRKRRLTSVETNEVLQVAKFWFLQLEKCVNACRTLPNSSQSGPAVGRRKPVG